MSWVLGTPRRSILDGLEAVLIVSESFGSECLFGFTEPGSAMLRSIFTAPMSIEDTSEEEQHSSLRHSQPDQRT